MSGFGGFSFGSNATTTAATGTTFGSTSTFGSAANQNRTTTTGALPSFGSLGQTATSQPTTGFGSLAATAQQQQPTQQPLTGSLFNLNTTANTSATAQPSTGSGFTFNFSNQSAAKPAATASTTTATPAPAFGSLFASSNASTQPQQTPGQTTQANTSAFNQNLGGMNLMSTPAPAFSLGSTPTTQQSSLLGSNTTANQSLTGSNITAPAGLNLTTSATAKPASTTGFGALNFSNTSSSLATTTASSTSNLTTNTLATSLASNVTATTSLPSSLVSTSTAQQTTQQSAQQQPQTVPTPQQPTQMTFKQLEGYINVWLNELNQMEKDFQTQSQTINSWDSLLVNNGLKITSLNENLDLLKEEHKRIDQQLDFVISQQNELEQLLEPLEKVQVDLNINDTATTEREFTYSLVDTVSNDLQGIGTELQNFIKKLNETKANQDANDPLSSIGKILNSHLDALQYIEHQISVLKRNIET